MAGRFVKTRKMMQWTVQQTTLGVTAQNPNDVREIIADPVDAVSYSSHLVRILCSYRIALSNGTAGAANSVCTLGVLRAEEDMASIADSLSSADADDADMPWLFWRAWPLDLLAEPTPTVKFLDFGDGAWLDWQMRAGKGTFLAKDVDVVWVFSQFGVTQGSVNMYLYPKMLYSNP